MPRNYGLGGGLTDAGGFGTGEPASRDALRSTQSAISYSKDWGVSDADREFGAGVFAALCCASPFIIFGISYIVIRCFS